MICLNQYKLLGFLSMLLAVDAWFMDTWNGGEEEPIVLTTIDGPETLLYTVTEEPVVVATTVMLPQALHIHPHAPHNHHPEPQVHWEDPPVAVVDHWDTPPVAVVDHWVEPPVAVVDHWNEPPVAVVDHWVEPPVAVVKPMVELQPLKIEQIWKEEVIETVFHEILPVSFITSETWFSTVTETKTIIQTAFQRSTVIVTPQPMYQTRTKIMSSVYMVEAAAIATRRMLISETQLTGITVTSTSTRWRTQTTRNTEQVTMEEQIIRTVWEPYTVTVTGLSTVTEWETRPFELLQEHRVRIPVVSIITKTTRLPHHKTMTNWVTRTATSTIGCVTTYPQEPQHHYDPHH